VLVCFFLLFVFSYSKDLEEGRHSAERLVKEINTEKIDEFRYKYLPKEYSYLPDLIKKINSSQPILTINFLTSSSVPLSSHISFSNYSRKLKKEFNVQTKMCMIGIESNDFSEFISSLMQKLNDSGDNELGIDFCPQIFEDMNLTRVPAYVISVCPDSYTHPEECDKKYIIRGDVSLKFALEKLSESNEYFKDMYEAL